MQQGGFFKGDSACGVSQTSGGTATPLEGARLPIDAPPALAAEQAAVTRRLGKRGGWQSCGRRENPRPPPLRCVWRAQHNSAIHFWADHEPQASRRVPRTRSRRTNTSFVPAAAAPGTAATSTARCTGRNTSWCAVLAGKCQSHHPLCPIPPPQQCQFPHRCLQQCRCLHRVPAPWAPRCCSSCACCRSRLGCSTNNWQRASERAKYLSVI